MSEEKLKQYQHAMEIDQATGKPMPKMSIAGASDGGGALGVNVKQSEIVQPTDLQSRYSQTIQTHNAVSVAASASTTRVEVPTKGYSKGFLVHSANGNAQAFAQIVMSNGTLINTNTIATTASNTGTHITFDLNGVDKISVYGTDTSGATNAITIEVSLLV